jgi:hypothetical protein
VSSSTLFFHTQTFKLPLCDEFLALRRNASFGFVVASIRNEAKRVSFHSRILNGAILMVDENRKTPTGGQSELSTPRFDEHASAKAQPVTPIPKSRITILFERAEQLFTHSSRSVAMIVALGVATGALVGMALVKEPQSSVPGESQQASVLSDVESSQILEWRDAEVGVYGIQNSVSRHRRPMVRRSRVQNDGQPRAYRFAVIR